MRHLATVLAAIVIAPAAWLLLAYGQGESLETFAGADGGGALAANDFVRPAITLAAAGLLFGLLGSLRFSPLGAVTAGLLYSGSYLALLLWPEKVMNFFPDRLSILGRSVDPSAPLRTGTTLLVGALLLVGVVSIGRWRRWPRPDGLEPLLPGDLDDLLPARDFGDPVPTGWGDPELGGRPTDVEPARRNISSWVSSLRGDSRSRFVARPSRGPF